MLRTVPPLLSRRAITGVLVLWLCVMLAGVWAPMARAQMAAHGIERLCSGDLVPQWESSPLVHTADGDAQTLHHLLDCPLCLPVLAPPPTACISASQALSEPQPQLLVAALYLTARPHWPPARGPPALTSHL